MQVINDTLGAAATKAVTTLSEDESVKEKSDDSVTDAE